MVGRYITGTSTIYGSVDQPLWVSMCPSTSSGLLLIDVFVVSRSWETVPKTPSSHLSTFVTPLSHRVRLFRVYLPPCPILVVCPHPRPREQWTSFPPDTVSPVFYSDLRPWFDVSEFELGIGPSSTPLGASPSLVLYCPSQTFLYSHIGGTSQNFYLSLSKRLLIRLPFLLFRQRLKSPFFQHVLSFTFILDDLPSPHCVLY